MPKASIIVPAHNAAATLLATLDSLLNQTFRDFEVILVDDGSTDATRRIAEAYCADPRMRVVRQSRGGAASARNSGLAVARGRYVGFCDADDLWQPEKLATHVAHLDANPDVGISFSAAILIDEDDRPLGEFQHPKLDNISPAHLFKRNPIGTVSTVVARRIALEDLSYRPYCEERRDWVFDEHLEAFEDFECWLRLALTTGWKVEGVPGLLTRHRINLRALRRGVERQIAGWEQMIAALRPADPEFFARNESAARAHQLHFLTRSRSQKSEPGCAREEAAAALRPALLGPPKPTSASFAAMVRDAFVTGPIQPVERQAPASWV